MKTKVTFLFTAIILMINNFYAQDTIPLNNYEEISTRAANLRNEGKFHDAYLEYQKINKNDSNYRYSLITKSFYLINDEVMDSTRYNDVLDIVQIGIDDPNLLMKLNFFMNKGATLMLQKKYKEAIELYDEALKYYPKNNELYLEKGKAYEGLEDYDKAVDLYKKSIVLNPYFENAHLKLGNLCYRSNKITQALMCFNFYLLLKPEGSLNVLSSINTIVSTKIDVEKPIEVVISKDDESFEELDLIINNHVALNDKYKIKNKINVALVRQNHLLLNQLSSYEGNNGFFHTKYVPFYKWVEENKHFDNFIYTTCYSADAREYKTIISANAKGVKEFLGLSYGKIGETFGDITIDFEGKEQTVKCYYYNNIFSGLGNMNDGKLVGYWEFYSKNGELKSKGNFNDLEEREGEWSSYYENGALKEVTNYKKGVLDGKLLHYYSNGVLNYSLIYSENKLNGEYKLYNNKGALIESKTFVDDKLEGNFKSYFDTGEKYIEYIIPYKMGVIEGDVKQYYINGQLALEANFKNGEKTGLEKKYFKNGTLLSETEFVDGQYHGSYKEFHPNGEVKSIGRSENNSSIGNWKYFHSNGKSRLEIQYNKGEIDGHYKEYDTDGKLFLEYEYRKGKLYKFSFFNKSGELIDSGDKQSGSLNYKGYYPSGHIKNEGLYDLKGGKDGLWKFYTVNGTLSSTENYNEGVLEGDASNYFINGKIESVKPYRENVPDGYFQRYDRAGAIVEQGWFVNGNLEGDWITNYANSTINEKNYYYRNSQLGEQITYKVDGEISSISKYDDDNDLIWQKFYDHNNKVYDDIVIPNNERDTIETHYMDGKLYSKITYCYGNKNGLYENFYRNGKPKVKGNYLKNEKHGEWIWYYESGEIETKGIYNLGDLDGKYISYYRNGEVEEEKYFLLGELVGEEKDYNEKGILIGVTNYENGVKEGQKIFYGENGNLQLIRYYHNNILIGYSYLGKDGKEIDMIPIKKETGKIVAYFDNGNKSREMNIVEGEFNDDYIKYYYNGQIHEKNTYKFNESEGLEQVYFPNGKIKKESNYIGGDLDGKVTEYFENGKVKKETNYLLGTKHGKFIEYADSGTKLTEFVYDDGMLVID